MEDSRNGLIAEVDPTGRALAEAARAKGEIGDAAGIGTGWDTTNLAEELEVVGDTDCGTGGEDPWSEAVAEAAAGAYTGVAVADMHPFSIRF